MDDQPPNLPSDILLGDILFGPTALLFGQTCIIAGHMQLRFLPNLYVNNSYTFHIAMQPRRRCCRSHSFTASTAPFTGYRESELAIYFWGYLPAYIQRSSTSKQPAVIPFPWWMESGQLLRRIDEIRGTGGAGRTSRSPERSFRRPGIVAARLPHIPCETCSQRGTLPLVPPHGLLLPIVTIALIKRLIFV
jgi:hypothetical protein